MELYRQYNRQYLNLPKKLYILIDLVRVKFEASDVSANLPNWKFAELNYAIRSS